ncbi:MAG TPA: hypothetical protein PLY26_13855 [Ferruginibacter sp.]|nr:hypothetical protein [Ferruginibacter sp.]
MFQALHCGIQHLRVLHPQLHHSHYLSNEFRLLSVQLLAKGFEALGGCFVHTTEEISGGFRFFTSKLLHHNGFQHTQQPITHRAFGKAAQGIGFFHLRFLLFQLLKFLPGVFLDQYFVMIGLELVILGFDSGIFSGELLVLILNKAKEKIIGLVYRVLIWK